MPVTSPKKQDAPSGHPSGDPRYKGIDRVLKRQQYQQDALIEVLTSAQEAFGYLTEDVLIYTARQLKLPFSWVYGVATFYHFFSLKPLGEHNAIVCMGTACYVGKAADILDGLEKEFGVKAGTTTPDGKLTVTSTRCLGCCGLAPVVVLDQTVLGKESPGSAIAKVKARLASGPVVSSNAMSEEGAEASA